MPLHLDLVTHGKAPDSVEENLINDNVIRFLHHYISSVAQLEILLLLQTNAQQAWPLERIVRELRTDPTGTAHELDQLCRNGLLQQDDSKDYFYLPANEELRANVVALAQAYLLRRVTVIGLIFAKPSDGSLRAFSDAFRLRKGPNDGTRS
jgi:hypothetical protein